MLYSLVSLFGMAVWVTASDLVQHYRDSESDLAAAQLGSAYAWGGVEFYEKVGRETVWPRGAIPTHCAANSLDT